MTELQSVLLEILRYFHDVCEQHHIRYYVVGGTCLGAIRHHGFIPWDDDIDVGLPRKDYDKLIEVLKDQKDGKYVLECPGENEDFVYSFCKLYDTETTLTENTRYKSRRGSYIDIFPLDGAGDTMEEALQHFKKIDRRNNMIHTKICAINPHRKFYKNAAIVAGRCIPEFLCSWKRMRDKTDALCRSKSFEGAVYACNPYGAWHEREIIETAIWGNPTPYTFENITVYGPENADAYLTHVYGDYMTPPPKDKQGSHHDFLFLDLHQSYLK